MMRYLIAMGGNIGKPAETFARAIELLQLHISPEVECSSLYWTEPLRHPSAPVRQHAYLNGVVALESFLLPELVLDRMFEIECLLGRVRANEQIPWGPRTIDLDLIAVDDQIVSTKYLELPHPRMHQRDFVLIPMRELAPEWRHPVSGLGLDELIDSLEERWIIEPFTSSFAISGATTSVYTAND